MLAAVFLLNYVIPVARYLDHVLQIGVDFVDFSLCACNHLLGLVLVELEYARHFYFHEPQDVVFCYFAQ